LISSNNSRPLGPDKLLACIYSIRVYSVIRDNDPSPNSDK
jgi:hypothetical protein